MLLTWTAAAPAAPTVGGPIAPDGKTQVMLDVPEALRIKNRGGTDGFGLCVWASITVSAQWQNEARLFDLFQKMTKKRGGGWPERVDQELKPTGARYLQYRGRDLALLRLALRCGRAPAITWNGRGDPNYRGFIAHMVNVVHLDEKWAAIMDNNHPGRLLWMSPDELLAGAAGRGSFWTVVLLDKGPPPPIPVNSLACGDDAEGGTPDGFYGPNYQWYFHPTDAGRVYLYDANDKLCGAWCHEGRYWRSWDEDQKKWLSKRPAAPFDPPAIPSPRPAGYKLLGTATDYGSWLHWMPAREIGEEVCELNGVRVTPQEAWLALARAVSVGKKEKGQKVPDDSKLLRLTVVGSPELRKAVLADLDSAAALAPFKGKLLVQDYSPDSPLVTGVKLAPGIVIQAPPGPDGTGKELHRQKDYSGPKDLARAIAEAEARRVPADGYDPAKTPDLRQQKPAPAPQPAPTPAPQPDAPTPDVATPVAAGGAAGILVMLAGRLLGGLLTRLRDRHRPAPPDVQPAPVPMPPPPVAPAPAPQLPVVLPSTGRPLLDLALQVAAQKGLELLGDYLDRVMEEGVDNWVRRVLGGELSIFPETRRKAS